MAQGIDEEEASPLTGGDSSGKTNKPSSFAGVCTLQRIVVLVLFLSGFAFFYFLGGSSVSTPEEIHQNVHSVEKHSDDGAKSPGDDLQSSTPVVPVDTVSAPKTTVKDLMQKFQESYKDVESMLAERYGEYYKPIFYDNDTPRGRFVFEAGERTSTLSQDRFRRKLKLKVLDYLTLGTSHFVWATGGHSATAGHGNFFDESYTSYLEQAAQPVFEAMGMNFTGRNYAMGGTAAAPESALCSKEIYGQDIDALVWDFGMTDGHQYWRQSLFHIRAGMNKGRPISFAYHTGKRNYRNKVVAEIESMGLGAFISDEALLTDALGGVPDSFGMSDAQIDQLPLFVRNFKCNGAIENGEPYCKDEKFNNTLCTSRKFKTSWHPGWKWQSVMGTLAAVFVLEHLGHVLLELADVSDLNAEKATLRSLEEADYAAFREAPIPNSLTILVPEAQKLQLQIGKIVKGHNFCHTGRLPAEIRHKGILTESTKTGFTTFDMGLDLRTALKSESEGDLMPLVYNQDDRQSCPVPTNMDYKDFFFVRKDQGWKKLIVPNDSELKEYGTNEPLYGHVMSCFTLCPWGRCPPGVLQLEDFYEGKFKMQVNGQSVSNITKFDDCMLLRNEQGYKWELSETGRLEVATSISSTADDGSYVRFSAFVVWHDRIKSQRRTTSTTPFTPRATPLVDMVDERGRLILTEGIVLSAALFGVTLLWFRRSLAEKQKSTGVSSFLQRRHRSLTDLQKVDGEVSARGQAARIPPIPYLRQLVACFKDPCDPVHNPTGFIALCTAENKLITQLLAERCMHVGTATTAFADSSVFCYNSFLGMPVAREAAAYFLARRFLFPDRVDVSPTEALANVQPQHVALSAGAAPILNHLFYLLGQVGDACLIPEPYYAAFESDMNVVAGIVPFGVAQANPLQGPTEAELDLAFLQARSSGLNPRFLLLTNPNNPLAVIYRPDVMRGAVRWARRRKLHTIVDEIYALSTHEVGVICFPHGNYDLTFLQKDNHSFESIIRILNNELGADVHMIWGMSKDFGASGLRYGVLYSQNELMMEGFATLSTFTGVSGPIQYLASEILTDDVFVDRFLEESRNRLVNSYQICTTKLEEMVLPYVPAEAGMFVYADFSSLLPEKTFEWERKLSELMFEVRVVLTPGESQHDTTPGMFRICYAWAEPETLEIAMERLSRLVAKIRRMEWDDLNSRVLTALLYS